MSGNDGRNAGLLILSGPHVSQREQRLEKLASFLGCDPRIAQVRADVVDPARGDEAAQPRAIALSADAFAQWHGAAGGHATLDRLRTQDVPLVIFGWRADPAHVDTLRQITRGAVADIQPLGTRTDCSLPLDGREWTRQLAGVAHARSSASSAAGLVAGRAEPTCQTLIACGGLATLAVVGRGQNALFCIADSEIADVDEVVSEDRLPERWPAMLPYLIALKYLFGETCWHSSLQTMRLIIDDPLLKRRYGLLDYETLLRSMDTVGYGSTIAFIPWSYRRTSRASAAFFREQSTRSRFSICVHGCDHTGDEFASDDVRALEQRAALALSRLTSHEARTGVPFEPVMVFPHAKFSSVAAAALRTTGYRAAINTTTFPVDHGGVLTIRDLLAPAVTRFQGFPIFRRHYPKDPHTPFALALDLYLGRPAFIVEHQEFFGDGMPVLESLVRELAQRSPGLQSLPLNDAVTQASLRRITAAGTEIRFFTDRFSLGNSGNTSVRYTLRKDEPDPDFVAAVAVNGAPAKFRKLDGAIEITADVAPGARVDVAVSARSETHSAVAFGIAYQGKVLGRRALSEFRDEVLSHHPAAFSLAKRSVGLLRTVAKRLSAKPGA